MPGTFTNVGADRMYDGFFSGGVYVSLHTNTPPTEANKIQDSWYSDVQVAAGAWSEHDDGDYREVDNDSDIDHGTTPAAGALSDAEAVAIASGATMSGTNLLWYDDDPSGGHPEQPERADRGRRASHPDRQDGRHHTVEPRRDQPLRLDHYGRHARACASLGADIWPIQTLAQSRQAYMRDNKPNMPGLALGSTSTLF